MKKLITFLLFFVCIGASSQTVTSLNFDNEEEILRPRKKQSHNTQTNTATEDKSSKPLLLSQEETNHRLIKKADSYFEKMWYAEAAELYELALKKESHNYSMKTLQRTADSHYFNANMEKAYFWYNKLYSLYEGDISNNTFFKYTHTLKGTGRYQRAKRLMRLFSKKEGQKGSQISLEEQLAKIQSVKKSKIVEIKNLKMNSEYSDFSPVFHNQNEVVFASAKDSAFLKTRRYKWNNQPFLDLYKSEVDTVSQELKKVKKFSKNVNSKYHEASATFSPDNNTIYFTRNNFGKKLRRDKNGINHLKIYMSKKINGEWSEAYELPFNSDSYSNGHPALSPDGKKLYFVSDMPGGFGKTDIYVVDVLENGRFSPPRNLGKSVNSKKKEMFPFVTDNTLYFSSDRGFGFGGLDVYKSRFIDSNFEIATNVGEPINGRRDDFSYIINENTRTGYFASNRRGGKGDDDIYSFKIKNVGNFNAISGIVIDEITGEKLPDAYVILLDNGEEVEEASSNTEGYFSFEELLPDHDYTINITKDGYHLSSKPVTTQDNVRIEKSYPLEQILELDEDIVVEKGVKKFKTNPILFDFDQHYIRKDASKELDRLVQAMKDNVNMVIKIESHTDAIGDASYNKYLSDKRAKSTKAYLVANGIEASRIESAIGYGEERLLNDCGDGNRCSIERHRENRRSEFIIVNM